MQEIDSVKPTVRQIGRWTVRTTATCPEGAGLLAASGRRRKNLTPMLRMSDGERAALLIGGIVGRRLTYRRIDSLAA
jgi:hypothetical protein